MEELVHIGIDALMIRSFTFEASRNARVGLELLKETRSMVFPIMSFLGGVAFSVAYTYKTGKPQPSTLREVCNRYALGLHSIAVELRLVMLHLDNLDRVDSTVRCPTGSSSLQFSVPRGPLLTNFAEKACLYLVWACVPGVLSAASWSSSGSHAKDPIQ